MFFYVYDGQGNIVQSIDFTSRKCYNYEYEEGRIIRATESNIGVNGEIITSKTIVNTIKYYYDSEGKPTKKFITPADGRTITAYSKTDFSVLCIVIFLSNINQNSEIVWKHLIAEFFYLKNIFNPDISCQGCFL